MDFDLSDEQRLLQETVAQFMDNECPLARLRELYDDEVGFDPVLWKGLAELGLAGIHLPGEYGGSELEILDLAVVAETLGSLAAPVPFLSHSLASLAISLAGSEEQKSRWLPEMASGRILTSKKKLYQTLKNMLDMRPHLDDFVEAVFISPGTNPNYF